jgi:hypothetical protein
MKVAITRWKVVLSYLPSLTRLIKLPDVMGLSVLKSMVMSPAVVWSRTLVGAIGAGVELNIPEAANAPKTITTTAMTAMAIHVVLLELLW